MRKTITIITIILLALFMISCENTENPFQSENQSTGERSLAKKGPNAINTWVLTEDMVVTETVLIPPGFTLDGGGHTITAVDPDGGHFVGAVVANEGNIAHVKHLTVNASGLANSCDGGADRLRGIMFEGASGTITNCKVVGINQGPSGCQEGNGIEIRNAPFDGSHPGTQLVTVSNCQVYDYQKTGIVANGDVEVGLFNNKVGESATQENLAANSVQFGFGAMGTMERNQIDGNQWLGTSNYAASAVLLYACDQVTVKQNVIKGNSEVGIWIEANNCNVINNKVFDEGDDAETAFYDYGIGNWGADNSVVNNKVRGFEFNYDGVSGGNNKAIPGGPID